MRRALALFLVLLVAALGVQDAWAGGAEQKVAVRRSAEWAADAVLKDLARSPDVRAAGLERIGVVIRPEGPLNAILHAAIGDALTDVPDLQEVWPKQDVRAYVDLLFHEPDEIRYDPETLLRLTGAFDAADGLLIVHYAVDETDPGGTRVDVRLSVWGRKATKLWGAHHGHVEDLGRLAELRGRVEAGRIDEALARIEEAKKNHPEWATDLDLLGQRAETLRAYRQTLALAHAYVSQSRISEALTSIRELYDRGDASLHEALRDLLFDLRAKLAQSAAVWIDAGDLARAKRRLVELEEQHGTDLDLMALASLQHRRIRDIESAAVRADAEALEAEHRREQAKRDAVVDGLRREQRRSREEAREAERHQIYVYAGAGLLAVFFLSLVVRLALYKRRRIARRNLGIDTLEREADQADRVKGLLLKDADVRAGMLREIDRAEDALADAHQRAQDTSRPKTARALGEGSERLRELRRRVKLAPHGEARPFLKGKLPKRHLVDLVSWLPAIAAHTTEMTHEATAAYDAVRAGGDPRKNLELLGGLSLRIQNRLAERAAFFTTRT